MLADSETLCTKCFSTGGTSCADLGNGIGWKTSRSELEEEVVSLTTPVVRRIIPSPVALRPPPFRGVIRKSLQSPRLAYFKLAQRKGSS
jgi:hypothetical protein